ncbi:hypothetical protein AVEN_119575-1 [Araneus ventricosus]|uniref:Uncharacterized protein n=1 Tax=Araneus ventricosus TaxID=182803 RepID=A0A4Y2B2R0_ARAVE|nr:hypothetical protein AVEN_33285-1 [Araneus ventricosus]GBL85345.1 hypothetical protein AVEN_119575-1 [Araneus ventricosus]
MDEFGGKYIPTTLQKVKSKHMIRAFIEREQNRFFGRSENCNCGADKRDTKHLLSECGVWNHERETLNLDWKISTFVHQFPKLFKEYSSHSLNSGISESVTV